MVNKRKVWGGLVPYGQVWRAGANENTTIKFTDPVTVEGKPLPKGTYGLHMIPGENEWTVIFLQQLDLLGSFTYDQAEDALRVTVKPQTAEFHEALAYDFDDVTPDSSDHHPPLGKSQRPLSKVAGRHTRDRRTEPSPAASRTEPVHLGRLG